MLGVVLIVGLAPFARTAGAAQSGYVAYGVRTNSDGVQKAYLINESVSPGPSSGDSILTLVLSSASTNVTYSHLVNSSLELFPYLPTVANLTYSYKNDSTDVTARVAKEGSSHVALQDVVYSLQDYSFYANVTRADVPSQSVDGNFTVMPSGLVYSVFLTSNETSAVVTLVSTSLPLQASSGDTDARVASAGVGVSAVVGSFALALGVKSRHRNKQATVQRPDHWVD